MDIDSPGFRSAAPAGLGTTRRRRPSPSGTRLPLLGDLATTGRLDVTSVTYER